MGQKHSIFSFFAIKKNEKKNIRHKCLKTNERTFNIFMILLCSLLSYFSFVFPRVFRLDELSFENT